jgi:hypothetical protein
MTAGISLIPGKTGAHRAPLQLLEPPFSATCLMSELSQAALSINGPPWKC